MTSGPGNRRIGRLRRFLSHRLREGAYGVFFSTVFLLCQSPANSLAIDDIRVLSKLGQPLVAEIAVTPAAGEVLNRGCFSTTRATGQLPGIGNVRLSLSQSLGGHVIGVASARPLREPMSEFILQVKCPGVPTMVKTFLVMVDPPGAGETGRRNAPLSAGASEPVQPATPGRLTSLRADRRPPVSGQTTKLEPGSRYTVRTGDMLSTIAARVAGRPDWSVWPIAQKIYSSNPGAFLLGDPNVITVGSTIYIPRLNEVDMRMTTQVRTTLAAAARGNESLAAASQEAVAEPSPAPKIMQPAARILPPPAAVVASTPATVVSSRPVLATTPPPVTASQPAVVTTMPAVPLPILQLTTGLLSASRVKIEMRASGMPAQPVVTVVNAPAPMAPQPGPQSQPDRPDNAATATRAALQPSQATQQNSGLSWLWVVVLLLTGLLIGAITAAALLRRNLRREYEHDVREAVTRQVHRDVVRKERDRQPDSGSEETPVAAAATMELPRPEKPLQEIENYTVEMSSMPGLDFEVTEDLPVETDTTEVQPVSDELDLELPDSTGITGQHEVDFDLLEQAYSEDYQTEFVEKDVAGKTAADETADKDSFYHLENRDAADDTPLPIELGDDEMGSDDAEAEPKVIRFPR